MRLVFICSHCQRLLFVPKDNQLMIAALAMAQRAATGRVGGLSPTKARASSQEAKEKRRAAQASSPSSSWGGTTPTQTRMEEDCASISRLVSALMPLRAVNASVDGIGAAGRIASLHTPRRSTTNKSDGATASALWWMLVRLWRSVW